MNSTCALSVLKKIVGTQNFEHEKLTFKKTLKLNHTLQCNVQDNIYKDVKNK